MPRPLVAVFQEFANITLPTPAAADLNTCVMAVAKQVVDYDSANVAATLVSGATYGVTTSALSLEPVGLKAGAVLESASVTFFGPEVLVTPETQLRADTRTVDGKPLTNAILLSTLTGSAAGIDVAVGHKVYAKNDVGERVALGAIVGLDAVEDPDDASVTVYRLSFASALPAGLNTTAIDGVMVTRALAGAYDANDAFVAVVPEDGTVSLSPNATVAVGSSTLTVRRCSALHVAYVARRTDLNFVQEIADTADAVAKVGPADDRNPLGLAVYLALQNAGTKVFAYGIEAETDAAIGAFKRKVLPRSDIYCIVPVCMTAAVQKSTVEGLKASLNTMSDPEEALAKGVPQRFKMVVAGGFPAVPNPRTVVTLSEDAETTALDEGTRIDDPNAKFMDDGVRVGDAMTTDVTDYFNTDAGVVTKVISNTALIVDGTITDAALLADQHYVVRPLIESEVVDALSAQPKVVNSKRVVMLLGDAVRTDKTGDKKLSAAYLGCAVGGMVAGLPPHSGLTNLSVAGITDVLGTADTFSEENLSVLSDAGWCVFVEDPTNPPYCMHGVTTDPSALEFREIMSVKNFDYVSATLSAALNQFLGTWNINQETLGFISGTLSNVIASLVERKIPKLGAPLIAGSLDSIGQHSDQKDRVEVYVTLQMPKSLNRIGLHLVSA